MEFGFYSTVLSALTTRLLTFAVRNSPENINFNILNAARPFSLSKNTGLCFPAKNKLYKYQLSLTNPRDALRHGKRAANKGGRSV